MPKFNIIFKNKNKHIFNFRIINEKFVVLKAALSNHLNINGIQMMFVLTQKIVLSIFIDYSHKKLNANIKENIITNVIIVL